MSRGFRLILGLAAAALLAEGGQARAQYGYYPGYYRGFGWSGYANDPAGTLMTGIGNYARAEGSYEVADAKARQINLETVLKWNKAVRERQRALHEERQVEETRRRAEQAARGEDDAIEDGTLLNALLDQILDAGSGGTKPYASKQPLNPRILRDIPFESETEAITICLDQMTAEDAWPFPLNEERFATERDAVHRAVDDALNEDARGEISPATAKAVDDAIAALRDKFHETTDDTVQGYDEADAFLRTEASLTRLLHNPRFREILAELEQAKEGDVGDLIAFMQAFNLRFGEADTDRQERIYEDLYRMLTQVRDEVRGAGNTDDRRAADNSGEPLRDAAREAFQGMTWKNLDDHAKPAPPAEGAAKP